MAQALSQDLINAVMQAESRGQRYDSKGNLLTSKKGAKGEMQVLDKTNYAPGFGVAPAKDKSPEERARVGRDYLAAMVNRYPDRDTALMAYNWGPGNVDKWLQSGAPEAKIPEETRNYVSKIDKMLMKDTQQAKAPAPAATDRATLELNKAIDSGISAQAPAQMVPAAAVVASAPSTPNVVSRTAAYGPSYQAALAVSMLGDSDEKEDKDPDEPTVAEKFLASPTSASALAKLDLSYASPFAEPEPVKLSGGGDVGDMQNVARKSDSYRELEKYLQSRDAMPDVKMSDYMTANGVFNSDNLNIGSGVIKIDKDTYKDVRPSILTHEMTHAADRQIKQQAIEQGMFGKSNQLTEAYGKLVGPEGEKRTEFIRRLNPDYARENRLYRASPQEIPAHGVGAFVEPTMQGPGPRHLDATSATEFLILLDLAQRNVDKGPTGLAKIPAFFRKLGRYSDGGDVGGEAKKSLAAYVGQWLKENDISPTDLLTMLGKKGGALGMALTPSALNEGEAEELARRRSLPPTIDRANGSPEEGEVALTPEEIAAASRPATVNPNIQRQGAAARQLASMRDVNTLPDPRTYAAVSGLLGQAPDEQGFSAMHPQAAGIKSAGEAGFYTGTALGIAPMAAALRVPAAALAKSEQAKGALERLFPAAQPMYAVRQRGVPVAIAPKSPNVTEDFLASMSADEMAAFRANNPDVALFRSSDVQGTKEFGKFSPPVDEAEVIAKGLATTRDQPLNSWFSTALPRYLRTDFATTKDQLVMAADDKKLLHLAPKNFSDSASDQNLKEFLKRKQEELVQTRATEAGNAKTRGLGDLGSVAKTEYGKRVEDLTDLSAYMDSIDVLSANRVPPSMRSLVQTDPEARVTEFAPGIIDNLKLDKLRDKMLEIRRAGPEFSAYGQPPAKIPDELLLPDDTLAKLNVAGASNRVARYTRWQDETRQGMATTALRSDPAFTRQPLQDGKFIGVALPDVKNNPDYMRMVTDVGCDGGWCTRYEANANTYASEGSQLHVIITGQGKQARPIAQFAVDKLHDKDGRFKGHTLYEIKEAGNTADFAGNPNLPAIQEYVQHLDRTYGGLAFVDQLPKLGMKQLPKGPTELLSHEVGASERALLEKSFGSEREGLKAVRDEAIKLNNGSQYMVGNSDDVSNLLKTAARSLLGSQ